MILRGLTHTGSRQKGHEFSRPTEPRQPPSLHATVQLWFLPSVTPCLICDLEGRLCRPASLCHFLAGHLKSLYRIKEFSVLPEVCSGPSERRKLAEGCQGLVAQEDPRSDALFPASSNLISSLNSCQAPKIAQPLPLTFAS